MKISKTLLISVGVGIVVIAGISLGMALNQQSAEKLRVEKDLNSAKKRLSALDNDKLLAQKKQLTLEIDEYASRTGEVKSRLSYTLDNINITDSLIKDAKVYGVDILEIVSPGLTSENLAGIHYESMNFSVRAQGVSETIAQFIYSLKEVFPTCVVKSVTLDIITTRDLPVHAPSTASSDNSTSVVNPVMPIDPGPVKDTVVNVNFVIYSYKGK